MGQRKARPRYIRIAPAMAANASSRPIERVTPPPAIAQLWLRGMTANAVVASRAIASVLRSGRNTAYASGIEAMLTATGKNRSVVRTDDGDPDNARRRRAQAAGKRMEDRSRCNAFRPATRIRWHE